jgi:hypothetical protein
MRVRQQAVQVVEKRAERALVTEVRRPEVAENGNAPWRNSTIHRRAERFRRPPPRKHGALVRGAVQLGLT